MSSLKTLVLTVACTAAVLTLAGCGQSGGSGTTAAPDTAPAETPVTPTAVETDAPAAPTGGEASGSPSASADEGAGMDASTDVTQVSPAARRDALGSRPRDLSLSRSQPKPGSEAATPDGSGLEARPTGDVKPGGERTISDQRSVNSRSRQTAQQVTTPGATPGASMITAEPTRLDLGEIPTAESGTGVVTLTNTGDEPRTLVDCKKTCGCTTINCPKSKVLQPGESVEIEIRLNGGTRATKLNKNVTFIFSDGHPPVRVGVAATAVSFVKIEPEILDKTRNPDGKITLTAIDDQLFTIKSMYPPVIEEFDAEPKAVQEVMFDWTKWEELGAQRKLLFTLDHPKCGKLYGTIDAASLPPRPPRPGQEPAKPRTPDLERMLKAGQIDEAITAIDEGKIDVASVNRAGKPPLLVASENGAVEVMQALLDASADVEGADKVGRTALMWAAQSKNVEAVTLLLDAGADINAKDNIGNNAVSWACGFGDAASVKVLLEADADIDVTGVGGFTPIIWAAGFGEPETIALLVEAGADINTGDVLQGATPLMHAVRTNRPDNVRVLLEAGADLAARDHKGQTPFLVACANSGADTAMIRMLLDAGANLDDVSESNQNALDLARRRSDLRADAVVALLEELMGVEPEPAEAAPAEEPAETGGDGG